MKDYYEVTAISAEKPRLDKYGVDNKVNTHWVEMTRAITPVQDLKAVYRLYKYFQERKTRNCSYSHPKSRNCGNVSG